MAEMLYELSVLNDLAKIMEPLKKDEQRRILTWLEDYFDIYDDDDLGFAVDDMEIAPTRMFVVEEDDDDDDDDDEASAEPEEETLESFFDKVHPKTAIQKIVSAAWWLENDQNKESWKSFEVNKLLKSADVKVSSISIVLTNAVQAKNPLVEELGRLGEGERSRKTFALTAEGIAYVEDRLA